MQELERIVERALGEFRAAGEPAALENAKARYLGKTGELTALLKGLGGLAPEERRSAGARINAAKDRIERALESRRAELAGRQRRPIFVLGRLEGVAGLDHRVEARDALTSSDGREDRPLKESSTSSNLRFRPFFLS